MNYEENELPDLVERILMFAFLYADWLGDDDLVEKTGVLNYSLNNFSGEDNAEAVYEKIQVLLGELFARLPVKKLDRTITELPENTPELKLIKQRIVLIAVMPLMDNGFIPDELALADVVGSIKTENNIESVIDSCDEKLNIIEDEILEKYFPERYIPED